MLWPWKRTHKKTRGLFGCWANSLFAKYCRHHLHHQPILIVVKCFLRMSFNLSQGVENKFISQWGINQKRVDFLNLWFKQSYVMKMYEILWFFECLVIKKEKNSKLLEVWYFILINQRRDHFNELNSDIYENLIYHWN